jgi:F0F1-type ATP synthase membrane subunit c/vacuolar-type H+-ATPase subunit K
MPGEAAAMRLSEMVEAGRNAPARRKEKKMRKLLELGGILAAAVLIGFGIASIVMSANGRSTVNSSLKQEQITGTPDMTPQAIAGEVTAAKAAQSKLIATLQKAGVKISPSPITAPSCSVAGKLVDTGSEARCFARYMRIHTFGASSGLTYSQMGRYIAKPNTPLQFTDGLGATSDPKYAQIDPKTQQPMNNGRRDIWVTYTALTTALNTSYMASQLALFGLVVGIALLLAGIGFGILAFAGALESPRTALSSFRKPKLEPPHAAVKA